MRRLDRDHRQIIFKRRFRRILRNGVRRLVDLRARHLHVRSAGSVCLGREVQREHRRAEVLCFAVGQHTDRFVILRYDAVTIRGGDGIVRQFLGIVGERNVRRVERGLVSRVAQRHGDGHGLARFHGLVLGHREGVSRLDVFLRHGHLCRFTGSVGDGVAVLVLTVFEDEFKAAVRGLGNGRLRSENERCKHALLHRRAHRAAVQIADAHKTAGLVRHRIGDHDARRCSGRAALEIIEIAVIAEHVVERRYVGDVLAERQRDRYVRSRFHARLVRAGGELGGKCAHRETHHQAKNKNY